MRTLLKLEQARYTSVKPDPLHWEAFLQIMKYLLGTSGYGIFYRRTVSPDGVNSSWVIERSLVNHPGDKFKFSTFFDSLNLFTYVHADHVFFLNSD